MGNATTDALIDGAVEDLSAQVIAANPERVLNLADKIGSTDDEINAWMLIFNCVKTKLYACRRRRNAHTSFNSLPLDIVLSIFRDAMEAFTETSNYYEELFTIRSVCSAWKTCIDDHPLFWVVVFPQNSPPLHDFTIRKARTLALELHYPLYIGMMYQQENCQQLLACLDGLHWPLKAFHFYDPRGEEGYPLLESFLTSPAPNLQSFELTTSTSRRVLGTLFDGQAPALRTVFLKHVVLNSTFQPFSRLQRLKLVEVYAAQSVKTKQHLRSIAVQPYLTAARSNRSHQAVADRRPASPPAVGPTERPPKKARISGWAPIGPSDAEAEIVPLLPRNVPQAVKAPWAGKPDAAHLTNEPRNAPVQPVKASLGVAGPLHRDIATPAQNIPFAGGSRQDRPHLS